MSVLTPRSAAEMDLTDAAEANAEQIAGEIWTGLPLSEKIARALTQLHRINGEGPVLAD
jgi:hypothetical protein